MRCIQVMFGLFKESNTDSKQRARMKKMPDISVNNQWQNDDFMTA